jgi:hypothetical protein
MLLTLDWKWNSIISASAGGDEPPFPSLIGSTSYDVVVQLLDDRNQVLAETTRPLLYGVLRPKDWSGDVTWGKEVMQHLQPLTLPLRLPAGSYRLAVTLRWEGGELAPPRALTTIVVDEQGGRLLGEQGYFVPKLLLDTWRELGGYEGPGDPLMPAAPFAGFTVQCFVRDCLQLSGKGIERLPLGELIHLVDAGLPQAVGSTTSPAETTLQHFPETDQQLSGAFLTYWRENGAMARLGPPISGELLRGDLIVQYTRYARLERPASGDGEAYRWP